MTISIITPSYNQGQFIERTVQSVLSQNINNLDYLIMDGGSTDNSSTIFQKFEAQLKWISEKDKGQAHAINKGISLTSGAIIGWLNSDDIYYPNALQTVYDFFATHPNVDVLYGNAYHIDENDNIVENYATKPWNIEALKDVCYLSQPAVFFRRSVVEQFGMLDEDLQYCLDYEYWLRLALNGARFFYLPQVLAGSRLHPSCKTIAARVKVHYEINNMLKKILTQVPDRWLSNYAHAKAESTYPHKKISRKIKIKIAIHAILASLRWNKWISRPILMMSLMLLKNTLTISTRMPS
jgi:glycosyltransferase involved in cell wall biosynthesis